METVQQPRPDVLHLRRSIRALRGEVFRPAPRLSLSEWADRHGYLSDGQRWDTSVVPYLREPMDATTDRRVREVVIAKAARIGYTEGVMGQRIGYDIHQDPERVLVVMPTDDDAKDWSQKQLTPMIDAAPVLAEIVPEARGRDSGNTIKDKVFPGGSITIRGAHSPKGLRRHTARDVILDEVDGFEVTSRDEGDPVLLAKRACRTIPDSKVVMGSTPKLKSNSRIWKALATSDWREYHVPCPHCETMQVLRWGGPDTSFGVKWAKEIHCKGCGSEVEGGVEECPSCRGREFAATHLPETAHYVCAHCSEVIQEVDKADMIAAGEWVPRFPGRAVRGYHISGLVSPFANASWVHMVDEFLKAKSDPAQLQVWVNQWLGEPFEERGDKVDPTKLEARAAAFVRADGSLVEVPDGVGLLTAGVDVQHDRLEVLVRGYGARWESWDILHERVYGPPQAADTWARLDHFLTRAYRHQNGRALHVHAAMVDSGDGQTAEHVYRFVKPRTGRQVWASKGDKGFPGEPPLKSPTKSNADGVRVWTIGTFAAKSSLLYRLTVQRPGLNHVHLRAFTPELCNGFDAEYFAQFGAEEKKLKRVEGSATYRYAFVQTRARNEAIDLHVLADSAFRAMGTAVAEMMPAWVEQAREAPAAEDERPSPAPEAESDGGEDWATGGGRWGSW